MADQCKKKNDLLIEYGDECANEAGLAVGLVKKI
jgi:hypothetical protein